jgi:hypothetical protein
MGVCSGSLKANVPARLALAMATRQDGRVILGQNGAKELTPPWPTTTRLVPPSPTRSGASNLDAIINEGTLTIGWVGPALLGILIAAFGWAGRVFEWLGTLATWLFSGEWRGGGEV